MLIIQMLAIFYQLSINLNMFSIINNEKQLLSLIILFLIASLNLQKVIDNVIQK